MFCVNGKCGTESQGLITSDAGDAGRDMEGKNDFKIRNWKELDIDGDGIGDIKVREGTTAWAPAPVSAPVLGDIAYPTAGIPYASYPGAGPTGWTPKDIDGDGIPDIMTRNPGFVTAGTDTTPCAGQVGLTGYNTQYVDCPTQRAVTESYTVPRTVVTNRLETRQRTRYVPKTVSTPVTKYRTETRMVPQQRTVPYTDVQYSTVNQPVTENYTVTIPQTRTYTENKYRTRYVAGTKKCPVKVPVYGASCGANALPYTTTAPVPAAYAPPAVGSALIQGSTGALVNVTGIPTSGAVPTPWR